MKTISAGMLPKTLEAMYHDFSFGGFEHKAAFFYDSVDQWKIATQHAISVLQEMVVALDDRVLADIEAEMIPPLGVNWRDRGLGVLFMTEKDLSCSNSSQAAGLRSEMRALAAEYISALNALTQAELNHLVHDAPLRCDKGKGAPIWSPGSDRQVTIAIHRLARDCFSADEVNRRMEEVTQSPVPACQTSYVRIQASTRMQPEIAVIRGALEKIGERRGPKVRRVAAQPFSLNHLWAGVGNLLRTVMKIDGHITGLLPAVIKKARRYKSSVAVDLKAYDTTVGAETLEDVHEIILKPILMLLARRGVITRKYANLLLSIDEYFQSNNCLLPPRSDREAAWLAVTQGMIRSGENLTSWKGSVINNCRIRAKAKALGVQMDWCVWGDDTIIFSDDGKIADKWTKDLTFLGFREEVSAGPSYLMRYMPYGYNFVGRMVLSTINRESSHEPENTLAAAAAIAIRNALLNGHPGKAYYLKAISYPGAPQRVREAISAASLASDPVDISQAVAVITNATNVSSSNWDDLEQLIGQGSVREPRLQAIIKELHSAAERQLRRISMRKLDALSDGLSDNEAKLMLEKRSYARRRKQ